MKRILLILAALLLVPKIANASTLIDGLYYNLDSSSYTASVTYEDGSFQNATYVTGDLVIPEKVTYGAYTYSVTSIGEHAFNSCSGLTSVEIPNSVTSIGTEAFYRCSGLKSVEIGNSVTSIGQRTFSGCSGLTSVGISDLAAWCNINFTQYDSNPLYYAHHLYLNGGEITTLIIPNSITSIRHFAFFGCSGLTSVEIGNSVTSIGTEAFSYCRGLTSVEIGNSVTEIGESAFASCSGLSSIEIPNSVTEIGKSAFSYCSGLTSVEIGNSVTSIGRWTFSDCSSLTSVVIGESVGDIGDEAFIECPMLKEVYALPVTPPLAATNKIFDSQIYSSATLYVAEKSLERYKTISPWNYFLNIVGKDFENGEEPTQIRILPVLFPGESMKLCAVAEQDSAIESLSWSSSDSSIISVNGDGVAKALGLGSASISATTENGISAVLEILVIEDDGTGLVDLNIVNEYSKQNVYTLDGILLIENAIPEEIRLLSPGIYIIGGKKVIIR